MATPQPPLNPEQRLALEQKQKYETLARNAAIAGVVICPVVALMPPRKLDLYTFSLAIGFYLSADHLTSHYTGRGIVEQWSFPQIDMTGLPTEKARETQQRLAEEKKLAEAREAMREGRQRPETEKKSILQQLWMGDETEGWKERRLEEERKALEEGKSYTSMIFEQVWEVWNWDKKKNDGQQKTESPGSTAEEPRKS